MRLLALLAAVLLAACSADSPRGPELAGDTMGTQYSVKLGIAGVDTEALHGEIEQALADVNAMMSTYLPEAEISRFNASESTDWYSVSGAFCLSVEKALEISDYTDGAFDITVAPLVNLWGFGPGDMIDEPPADAAIEAMLQSIGYDKLHTDCSQPALRKDVPELMLDMSAFGKGFAVDRIAALLDGKGLRDYLIEVGGELRLRGHNINGEKWAIGIEMPLTYERRPHTVVRLTDVALATSGDYRNFFVADGQLYSHTIDTRTGKPVTHSLASVTVLDRSGYRADALATALLVMGPEQGMELAIRDDLAVLFLLRDGDSVSESATPAFEKLRSNG